MVSIHLHGLRPGSPYACLLMGVIARIYRGKGSLLGAVFFGVILFLLPRLIE